MQREKGVIYNLTKVCYEIHVHVSLLFHMGGCFIGIAELSMKKEIVKRQISGNN